MILFLIWRQLKRSNVRLKYFFIWYNVLIRLDLAIYGRGLSILGIGEACCNGVIKHDYKQVFLLRIQLLTGRNTFFALVSWCWPHLLMSLFSVYIIGRYSHLICNHHIYYLCTMLPLQVSTTSPAPIGRQQ